MKLPQLWRLRFVLLIARCPPLLLSYFILNILDYCKAVLACETTKDLKPLQKIQNHAVRYVCRLRPPEHITPHSKQLYFLPVKYRIVLCV